MYVVTLWQIAAFASICCVMQLFGSLAAEIILHLFDKIKKWRRMPPERTGLPHCGPVSEN